MDESAATPRLPQFVAELEAELQRSAGNLDAREQLIDYYSKLAAQGNTRAPKYVRIPGVGGVEEICDKCFAALK